MKVSVVMLTYNAGPGLRRVLERLGQQDIEAEVEYVAVDSGSTDGSCELLESAGFHVYHVDHADFSFGPVREYAFQCSSGAVIVTQSQDVVPRDERYLRSLTDDIIQGRADVVQGIVASPLDDEHVFLWDRKSAFYFTNEGRAFIRQHGGLGLSCTCLALSRAAWKATGFGDTPFCSDKFLQRRLSERRFRMVLSPGVVAWHGHSYTLKGLIKRCLNEGAGWRIAGARYSVPWFLYDLTVGFAKHGRAWVGTVLRGQARDLGSIFFFQIRPVCVLIGNRLLKRVV